MDKTAHDKIQKLRKISLMVALISLALSALGFFIDRTNFAFSYLTAYLYCTALIVGCMPLIMIHHLTSGGWGFVARRTMENVFANIPLIIIAFIPVALCMKELYIWTHPELVAHDHILQAKEFYLNIPFFLQRAAVYFALWLFFSWALYKGSLEYDRTQDPKVRSRLARLSGIGLVVYALSASFAGIDWCMTLDPYWFSTIFGAFFMIGNGLAAFAAVIITVRFLYDLGLLKNIITEERSHELGTLLFAFIMLWAYMHLSQFMIIWHGNLPEETPWYMRRFNKGWNAISIIVTFFHFVIPWLILLHRNLKKDIRKVSLVACIILVVHWLELVLFVKPSHFESFHLHWLDITCLLALGGFFKFFTLGRILKNPVYLANDPQLNIPAGTEHHA